MGALRHIIGAVLIAAVLRWLPPSPPRPTTSTWRLLTIPPRDHTSCRRHRRRAVAAAIDAYPGVSKASATSPAPSAAQLHLDVTTEETAR